MISCNKHFFCVHRYKFLRNLKDSWVVFTHENFFPQKFFPLKYNKTVAQNCFTVPILAPTVGTLDWKKWQWFKRNKKRKIATENFDSNSDLYKLYISKIAGSRGFRAINLNRLVTLQKAHLSGSKRNETIAYKFSIQYMIISSQYPKSFV